jgi:hypothetical protein
LDLGELREFLTKLGAKLKFPSIPSEEDTMNVMRFHDFNFD